MVYNHIINQISLELQQMNSYDQLLNSTVFNTTIAPKQPVETFNVDTFGNSETLTIGLLVAIMALIAYVVAKTVIDSKK